MVLPCFVFGLSFGFALFCLWAFFSFCLVLCLGFLFVLPCFVFGLSFGFHGVALGLLGLVLCRVYYWDC